MARLTTNLQTSMCPPFVAYETTAFNDFLYNFASKRHDELPRTHQLRRRRSMRIHCCRQFYRCGAMAGLLTSFSSVALLCYVLVQTLFVSSTMQDAAHSSAAVLTPLVPGVNVPWTHLVYIFLGYATATIVHEFGHGFAMATVGAHIESVGWFVMCGLPGAYVSCDSNTIRSLKPHRALRVYFAGVWHNVLLVVVICMSLHAWRLTPILPSLFYQGGDGINIVAIDNRDPKLQEWFDGGVSVGARIVAINDLPTSSLSRYENVLNGIMKETENKTATTTTMTTTTTTTVDGGVGSGSGSGSGIYPTIDVRFARLTNTLPWRQGPEALYHTVHVVESRPGLLLSGPCSLMMSFCLHVPTRVSLLLSYSASISGGLAFINSLPVFWLDGDDALGAWLQLLLPKHSEPNILRVKQIILTVGTFLLLSVVMLSFFSILS